MQLTTDHPVQHSRRRYLDNNMPYAQPRYRNFLDILETPNRFQTHTTLQEHTIVQRRSYLLLRYNIRYQLCSPTTYCTTVSTAPSPCRVMGSQGQLLTPSTYAGSDFGITPRGGALQRKWSASSSIRRRAQRKNAEQSSIVGSIELSLVPQTKKSTAKPRHVFKRAIHKIGKRFRQRSAQAKGPVVEAPPPPKVGAECSRPKRAVCQVLLRIVLFSLLMRTTILQH